MGWVLRLVETGVDGSSRSVDVMAIDRPGDLGDIADLGLTLAQGKQLVALVQQEIVTAQSRDHAVRRPLCRSCGAACQVKDYRPHQIATLFGQVTLRLPRFRCAGCGGAEAGHGWPAHCRSTPELDQVRAQFSACMPYRVAAGVLEHLLPIDAGIDPETLRACTLKVGEDLRDAAPAEPATAASAITLTLDSTFIRSCEDGQRHLEVRLGNVETSDGARQVFAAVAKTDTAIEALIRRGLAEVGQTDRHRADGVHRRLFRAALDPGQCRRHQAAGPRLVPHRHAAAACREDSRHPAGRHPGAGERQGGDRRGSRPPALADLERQGQGCQGHPRAHPPRHAGLPGRTGDRKRDPSSRRLWTALREIDRYLTSQSAWLVNYAERHRAGLRVGTSITEGTANFLVNRRMNKSQQMRWSRRGADLLLQVRCAGFNGKLGSSFGQLFQAVDPASELAMAA